MAIIFEELKVMNKDKIKLWNKIRSSRGLKGEESQLAQDVFSECYDTLTAKHEVDAADCQAILAETESHYKTMSKSDLEQRGKVKKLKALILLTDPIVSNVQVSYMSVNQWNEYVRCFPDEGARQ